MTYASLASQQKPRAAEHVLGAVRTQACSARRTETARLTLWYTSRHYLPIPLLSPAVAARTTTTTTFPHLLTRASLAAQLFFSSAARPPPLLLFVFPRTGEAKLYLLFAPSLNKLNLQQWVRYTVPARSDNYIPSLVAYSRSEPKLDALYCISQTLDLKTPNDSRLADQTHSHLNRRKRSSTDRHRPQQRRANTLPEPPSALLRPHLRKAVPHTPILLILAKPIALHLALNHIKRIAANPQHLSREPAIPSDLQRGDLLALDMIARRIRIHQVLKRRKPHAVRLRLTQKRHGRAAVHAAVGPIRRFAAATKQPHAHRYDSGYGHDFDVSHSNGYGNSNGYADNPYIDAHDGLYGGHRSLEAYPIVPAKSERRGSKGASATEWPLREWPLRTLGSMGRGRRESSPRWDRVYE
ncbi:hypothetical protein OPT61_g9547 [Boeremia exigua]|uniref:Uncharacterized protein n=1 Tax=Boeremia exigua TaxID=749465 RepID=A0ACC2HTY7_9PLEO|nr:hypothetical protein OPT61_g9547 [Boeremia exigua]